MICRLSAERAKIRGDEVLEGYDIRTEPSDAGDAIKIKATVRDQSNRVQSDQIEIWVFRKEKTIVIKRFYPEFPNKRDPEYRKGRGRALLWRLIKEFEGYEVIGDLTEPFQRSLLNMPEMAPALEINDDKISDCVDVREKQGSACLDEWKVSTVYWKVPTREERIDRRARMFVLAGDDRQKQVDAIAACWSSLRISRRMSGRGY